MHETFQDEKAGVLVEGQVLHLVDLCQDLSWDIGQLQERRNDVCQVQVLEAREIINSLALDFLQCCPGKLSLVDVNTLGNGSKRGLERLSIKLLDVSVDVKAHLLEN